MTEMNQFFNLSAGKKQLIFSEKIISRTTNWKLKNMLIILVGTELNVLFNEVYDLFYPWLS